MRGLTALFAAFALLSCSGAGAQSASYFLLQGQLQRAAQNVTALGHDLMGDQVNLYNGALQFAHEDVSLPGNSALPVAVARRHVVGRDPAIRGQLGDWDLDLPSIGGNFATALGWRGGGGAARCSSYSIQADYSYGDGRSFWYAFEFWHGTFLSLPGAGQQELLYPPSGAVQPGDGHSWRLVTANHWRIRCLPSILNAGGEGFVAKSPTGVEYTFNWMAVRALPVMRSHTGVMMFRSEIRLLPTLVKDRFGNSVSYTYDPANPWRLLRIQGSDGRTVDLTYANFSGGGRVASVSDGTRTWTYGYDGNGDLSAVTLPDGSAWRFALRGLVYPYLHHLGESTLCDWPGAWPNETLSGQVTHPSGAVGTFQTAYITHPRDNVYRLCYMKVAGQSYDPEQPQGSVELPLHPRETVSQTLVRKTLAGPGIENMQWTYSYPARQGTWSCPTCTGGKHVVVTGPRGVQTRYLFGTLFQANEGQLLQRDDGWNGTSALRTTTYRYRQPAGQAYPEPAGASPSQNGDHLAIRHRPLDRRVISQQGQTFRWQVDDGPEGFDSYARPRAVTRASSLPYSRRDITVYHDHTSQWVLGQLKAQLQAPTGWTGTEVEGHEYDPGKAQRTQSRSFGRLLETFDYHPDGQLHRRYDPLGRATQHLNYHRGMPRQVIARDGSSESVQMNNLGLITSHSNAAGTTTSYGYDAMGRLASIGYPVESWGSYHPTTLSFTAVAYDEYGMPAGHWRQTIATGNARTVRYFDALWRERLSQRFDHADRAGTLSAVETRYDADGNKAFESYPFRDDAPVGTARFGTSWDHDGLHRVWRQRQNSELGDLDTTTSYAADALRKTVTNPRGHATSFDFQAFDMPSEDSIVRISAPEGVVTGIQRDVYGKALSITRSGGSASVTRQYVYDGHQQLCKTVEPETGATVQAYDAVGNVQWRASGLNLPGNSCDRGAVPEARKVSFGYDARDRLTSTGHGDGSPGVSRSYTPDGLLQRIVAAGVGVNTITWTYGYNNRRLLTSELYNWGDPNNNWPFNWFIDPHGHVSGMSDLWGSMSFGTNALGAPTEVSGYVREVTYHANGAVAGYTLTNGIVHSVKLNVRGLPEVWQHGGVTRDRYAYDANGNVTSIADEQQGIHRSMSLYDGLDRLRQANGPWGAASFAYDALDNLVHSNVGGRSLAHNFDGNNRLISLSGSLNIGIGYDANGNITNRGGQTFTFDVGNRLKQATGKASYVYDGHGRRNLIWYHGGGYAHQAYTQDGKLRFGWRQGEGSRRFVYLGDKLIAERTEGGITTFSHTDALGSPVAKTASNGAVISRTRYEPYGATVAGSSNPTGIGFTGHVNDADTGLVYMQQRYYEPIAARFLSIDPVTTDPKAGHGFNRYVYGDNNPYKYVDPDGRWGVLAVRGVQALAALYRAVAATATAGAVAGGAKALSEATSGSQSSGGAKDAPTTTTDRPTQEWIYGPKDDPKVNPDGSTKPNTWTTPDNYPDRSTAQDKLDPFKPAEGKRPATLPAGTDVKRGKTPGGEGPYKGSGGANETLVPGGLPPGSVGPWEPLK